MNHSTEKTKSRRPMDVALSYLSSRMRTVREVELHLDKQQYGEYEIAQVVERLQELGYLNDDAYIREFIHTRIQTKPVSRNKLRMQLMQHALPPDLVNTMVYEEIDDDLERAHAVQITKKFARQLQNLPPDELRERLMGRLSSRGFTGEDILFALKTVLSSDYDA